MFMRKPQHRQFEYTPRYYDPRKDEEARRRRRIQFERTVHRGSHKPLLVIVVMFLVAYLLYTYLQ
ncbi:MAG: hypothetical protein JXA28_03750 [Bacteroidetes bacterium]|nr:hypothetical protein [Bacteroidota bacterium]